MNRLMPGIPAMPESDPAPSQGPDPIPGSKPYLQAQARQLGVATRGTKAEIWSRIAAKQEGNVQRRVRAPRQDMAEVSPTPQSNPLLVFSAPAIEPAAQADPFDDALARFETFIAGNR